MSINEKGNYIDANNQLIKKQAQEIEGLKLALKSTNEATKWDLETQLQDLNNSLLCANGDSINEATEDIEKKIREAQIFLLIEI